MRQIYSLLRISAWVLLILMPVSFFSGFLMMKQFVAPWFGYNLAVFLHTSIPLILLILLVYVHSMTGILVIFQRHPKWNRKVFKYAVGIFWTLLFLTMILLFFAKPPSRPASGMFVQAGAAAAKTYAMNEITAHNNLNDCWLLISGKVYDVTSFSSSHPGGPETIAQSCGTDATLAYSTKNIGRPHSSYAHDLLNNYYIGDLKQ